MPWLTAGWVRCSFFAAAEKLRSDATVRKVLRSWSCIGAEGAANPI